MSFKSVGIAHRIPIRMTTMPLIVALIMAFAVRLMARGDHLSSDEIYGATFANLGLWDVVVGSLRFDLHPPLYYLQIAVWALPSTADSWLLLNSLIWNLIALIGLYVAARRVFSESVAVTAALLFAVMPMSIQYANQLRMYALMMALAVAAWYALERLASDSDDQRLGALAVLAELGIVYSHATGFLMIVGFPVYMALRVLAG
jgi:mannosyltransferase